MPSSVPPAKASSKIAVEDALPPSQLEVKAPRAVGSVVGSRVGSAVGSTSSWHPRKLSIDELVREQQFCSEYTSHYKSIDPRASKNMQSAGMDVLKMQTYGSMAAKREASGASMVSACTLASKDGVTIPPPRALTKNKSAPTLSKTEELQSLANSEDKEGSLAGWRGLTIGGYRGPRAPIAPKSEMPRPRNDLYRSFHSEYKQSFHGRMPQGPGRAGNSSVEQSPLSREDLENWQQALEDERRRLEKDRAAIVQQQDLLVDQRARMKDALGFSGAN